MPAARVNPTPPELRRIPMPLSRPPWIRPATVVVVVFAVAAPAVIFADAITEPEALEQIVRLGGKVQRDENLPDRPLIAIRLNREQVRAGTLQSPHESPAWIYENHR